MAESEPLDHPLPLGPPPRPTTPPIRLSFILLLLGLAAATALVYGIPYLSFRAGYSYEAGRARAAEQSLARLGKDGVILQASSLFRTAARAVSPAVVNIQCLRAIPQDAHEGMNLPPGMRPGMAIPSSFGSGVVIDKENGYIVTNGHVVEGADEILVRLNRDREYPAKLVGADSKTDLAVLQINAPIAADAQWGDVDNLDIGDWVIAIGSPFTLDHTVTVGIVSAIGRRNLRIIPEFGGYEDFIQTDAAINPGNSGGPLIDLNGKIVGINTAIYSPNTGVDLDSRGGNVGIGFAISAALARNVVDQIIKSGRVIRSYMGISLADLDPRRARDLGLDDTRGALVRGVDPGGPADLGGLRPDDVVTQIDGQPVGDVSDLRNRISRLPVGSTIQLSYLRDGKQATSPITVVALPLLRTLGLRIRALDEAPNGVPPLVIDQVDPGSLAARCGFRPGDFILAIGNRPVESPDELETVAGRHSLQKGIPFRLLSPSGEPRELLLGDPETTRSR